MSIAEPIIFDMTSFEESVEDDDNTVHYYCDCSPHKAFCGEDLTDAPAIPPNEFSRQDVCPDCRKVEKENRFRCPWGYLPGAHP